jgi:hypothetical protein
MARLWRERWLELSQKDVAVVERLQDAEPAEAPATFRLEQILQLFAMACEPPEQDGRPISEWTARELANEMFKQGIVASIAPRHPTFRRLTAINSSSSNDGRVSPRVG